MRLMAIVREDRFLLALLVIVALLDILLVGLHTARQFAIKGFLGETILTSMRFELSYRMGFGNLLGLFSLAGSTVLGIFVFIRNRQPIYLCGSASFAAVLGVTSFSVHVPVGEAIGKLLSGSSMALYYGEAIGLAVTGIALLGLLFWGISRSSDGHARLGVFMAAPLVLLGLFAGGVDLVQALVYFWSFYLRTVLQVVEEGGELVTMSLALMLMAVAARRPRLIGDLL